MTRHVSRVKSTLETLFEQNFPDECELDALKGKFGHFLGFKKIRLMPRRRGIAIVKHDNEADPTSAEKNAPGTSPIVKQSLSTRIRGSRECTYSSNGPCA